MQRERFLQYARKAASLGFKVFVNKEDRFGNYAAVTDGKNVGMMYQAGFGIDGVALATCHKPCREYGTGFSCRKGEMDFVTLEALDEEKIRDSFSVVPKAFGYADRSKITKYADFSEWAQKRGGDLAGYEECSAL